MVTSILITGANVGLGYECARQLAHLEGVKKIILGCRNPDKAKAAKASLEERTGKKDLFESLIMDLSNLASVRNAVHAINDPIDALVLNAGASGGKNPGELTSYGVTQVVLTNVLGHVLLVDLLLEHNKLSGTVVFSGSEAARGAIGLFKPLAIKSGSVEEFGSILSGSAFKKKASWFKMYGPSKLIGSLWMSSMARKEPNIRFVTVSPGNSEGTKFHRSIPSPLVALGNMTIGPVLRATGNQHSTEVGAKRYLDVLLDSDTYLTGCFYASKTGVGGEVVDQTIHVSYLSNEEYQDNANTALHNFIKGG